MQRNRRATRDRQWVPYRSDLPTHALTHGERSGTPARRVTACSADGRSVGRHTDATFRCDDDGIAAYILYTVNLTSGVAPATFVEMNVRISLIPREVSEVLGIFTARQLWREFGEPTVTFRCEFSLLRRASSNR